MNSNIVSEHYSSMTTEKLIALSNKLSDLEPEAIVLLQNELLNRNKKEEALVITRKLISNKYLISTDSILRHITALQEDNYNENDIRSKLLDNFNIGDEQTELLRSELRITGRENLITGIALFLMPLIFGIFIVEKGGFVGITWVIILMAIGVWRLYIGYQQFNKNKKRKI